MRVVVIGAGIAGLGSALMLSRAGHDVTVVERDGLRDVGDPASAFAIERRGVPQMRHSHAYLARSRNILRDELPDVLGALVDAGVQELPFTANMPDTIDDPSPHTEDRDLVALGCRRTTFEWVLRSKVFADDRIDLRSGTPVAGVCLDADTRTARGVRTADGEIIGDVVVDAGGRRSVVPGRLGAEGIDVPEESSPTGIIYLSRFYRLLPGAVEPEIDGPWGGDLRYMKYAIFPGDNRVYSVTLALPTGDAELRKLLTDADTFQRTAALLPATAAWVDPGRAEPVTDVYVMARLANTLRRYAPDGVPLLRGLFAVGDAAVHTNPLYGRGCSLALVHARILTRALDENPHDPDAAAADFESGTAEEIVPWYTAAVVQDAQNIAVEEGRADATSATFHAVLREGLLPAMRERAAIFRGFWRSFNLLEPPNWFLSQPDLLAQIWEYYETRADREPERLGPSDRAELLDAIGVPA